MEPILRTTPNLYEAWMLWVFFLAVGLFLYVRVAYARRLPRLISSAVRLQILRQTMREELVFSHRASILLFLQFLVAAALLVYLALKYTGYTSSELYGIALYLRILGILAVLYLARLLSGFFLRKLYTDKGLLREYLFGSFLLTKLLGILLLPLSIIVTFANIGDVEALLWITAALTAGLVIYRIIQGGIMSLNYTVSGVYIILYLCTLEILPFIALLKLFMSTLG